MCWPPLCGSSMDSLYTKVTEFFTVPEGHASPQEPRAPHKSPSSFLAACPQGLLPSPATTDKCTPTWGGPRGKRTPESPLPESRSCEVTWFSRGASGLGFGCGEDSCHPPQGTLSSHPEALLAS